MKCLSKKYLLFCIILLCGFNIYGQQKPGLKLFFEKVYLHTDRNVYLQGDDIWLKAYLVNGQSNIPMGASGNLYVELIGPDSKIVSSEAVRIENGLGNSDFKLTDSVPAGKYRLRAYTNWMRNFGDKFIFEKGITILNAAPLAVQPVNIPTGKPAKKPRASDEDAPVAKPPVVRFFPEGGTLVNDVNDVVAVKAEDINGIGIPVSGEVIATSGRSVAKFTCDSLGFGSFSLTPDETQTYTANIIFKGDKSTVDLPLALAKGFVLSVSKTDSIIYTAISCNDATFTEFGGMNAVLVARHAGHTYFKDQIKLSTKSVLTNFPDTNLPEGLATITLYDERSRALTERVIYISHKNKAKLALQTDKKVYAPKGLVTVKLKVIDASAKSYLSLAAVDAGIIPSQNEDIVSSLLLQSEVRGKIEHIERYFDTTNVNRANQMDLLLLTQGWRDFLWKRLADSAISIHRLPENGFTISGRIRQRLADKPLPGINVTATAFKAKGQKLFFGRTDSLGRYFFDGLQLFGAQPVKLNARDDKGKPAGWLQADSLTNVVGPPIAAPLKLNIDSAALAPELPKIAQRQVLVKRYNINDTVHLKEITIKASNRVVLMDQVVTSFGYPDETFVVTPKDMEYKTLGDYILQKSNQAHTDDTNNIYFSADGKKLYPRLFDNGREVPFTDADPIELRTDYYIDYFTIPMDKVVKVVIKKMMSNPFLLQTGSLSSTETSAGLNDGSATAGSRLSDIVPLFIIYLTLKPNAMGGDHLDSYIEDVNGYYNARTFYGPKYTAPSANPDYRTTLHWEPNITTDANGEATVSFYNADPKTNIRVVAQGVTDKGVPVSATTTYKIQ